MGKPHILINDIEDVEDQDIADVIQMWEQSLRIQFSYDELADVTSFRELTARILEKINLEESEVKTFDIIFDLIKGVLADIGIHDIGAITLSTSLDEIIPWKYRKKFEYELEIKLNSKLYMFGPSCVVLFFYLFTLLVSLIILFFQWKIGLITFVLSWMIISLASNFSRKFYTDIEDLIESLIYDYYLSVRGDNRVNYNELEILIKQSFDDLLYD